MIFARNFGLTLDYIRTDEALYEMSVAQLHAYLRELPESMDAVMVFGHGVSVPQS